VIGSICYFTLSFALAYENISDGDVYTSPVQMESFEEVNRLGTAYTKPVGVLTNAECTVSIN
jgi:hypothetical protein